MEGIVIRVYASGESDAVLRVITKEHGKISLFAPRVRKSRKRFGSAVDLLDWGVFEVSKGKGNLPLVQSFVPRSSFPHLRANFDKLAIATFLCEAFDAAIPEEAGEEEQFFDALRLALEAVDQAESLRAAMRACYLALANLLQNAGLLTEFEEPSAHSLMRLASRLEHYVQHPLATKQQLQLMIDALRKEQNH